MAVLRFTAAGLVATPETVQIRVTRQLPGRLVAGAPEPARGLEDAEVQENLRHFTLGLQGPRTRPCTGLVLSGVALASRPGLAEVLRQGRRWGLQRVTLHLGRGQRDALRRSPLRQQVDDLAFVVRGDEDLADVAALCRAGPRLTAVVPLDAPTLPWLDRLAATLARLAPARVVLTWPLQGDPPPHAARVAAALPAAVRVLEEAGVQVGIKGLPLCALGPLARLGWRTGNRWYVDEAHQLERALLFLPDVIRFAKEDDCRFCAAADRCDGTPARWLVHGVSGPLRPISDEP